MCRGLHDRRYGGGRLDAGVFQRCAIGRVQRKCVRSTFLFPSTALESVRVDGTTFSSSNFLPLICSLPVLEDLHVGYLYPGSSDEVGNTTFWPLTSPPLTGTLGLALIMSDAIGCTVKRLMVLPIRFRRLEYFWWREEELPWIMSLVEACSDTLESLCVTDGTWGKLRSFSSCM